MNILTLFILNLFFRIKRIGVNKAIKSYFKKKLKFNKYAWVGLFNGYITVVNVKSNKYFSLEIKINAGSNKDFCNNEIMSFLLDYKKKYNDFVKSVKTSLGSIYITLENQKLATNLYAKNKCIKILKTLDEIYIYLIKNNYYMICEKCLKKIDVDVYKVGNDFMFMCNECSKEDDLIVQNLKHYKLSKVNYLKTILIIFLWFIVGIIIHEKFYVTGSGYYFISLVFTILIIYCCNEYAGGVDKISILIIITSIFIMVYFWNYLSIYDYFYEYCGMSFKEFSDYYLYLYKEGYYDSIYGDQGFWGDDIDFQIFAMSSVSILGSVGYLYSSYKNRFEKCYYDKIKIRKRNILNENF